MAWNYQRDESGNNGNYTTKIPEDKVRIRVKAAEMAVSSAGNDMLALQFDVSGYPDIIYHYIVFMKDNPQLTNQKLTQFFDSFKDIPDGEQDLSKWIGKVGAAKIKHEEYNGNVNAKIHWFVHADKQGTLPAWVEPNHDGEGGGSGSVVVDADGFMNIPSNMNEEVPFS